MLAVAKYTCRAGFSRQQKGEEWFIRLVDVACRARKDKVIPAIESRLAFSWCDVIESDQTRLDLPLAVGAHRSVCCKQPLSRRHVGVARGGQ